MKKVGPIRPALEKTAPIHVINSLLHHASFPILCFYLEKKKKYMGKEQRPYLILGLSIAILCSVLPILLLCFCPLSCLNKLLVLFRLNILTIYPLMDALQGHYQSKPLSTSTLPFSLAVLHVRGWSNHVVTLMRHA